MSRETGAGRLDEGRPSATAQSVARRRASHALRDHPPVLDDPFAVAIIGAEAADKLRREVGQGDENAWDRAMRAFMAMRSRLAEDRLAAGYDAGVRQYVVLGAGLDTYGCRNARPDLKVFEIDHPSTQAWKRGRLRECGIETAPGLVFVPVDFARQALGEQLAEAGFDTSRPAVFSWLGVTMYLTEEAVFQTLGYIAALPSPSEVVFDFNITPEHMSEWSRKAVEALSQRVAALGEPFRSAFDPQDLVRRLHAAGFSEAEVMGAPALNALYFDGRTDGLKLAGPGHMARARV
jgi:methyltransferase (TIGR00027 family)